MRGLQRVVSAKCKGKNGMPRGAGFWGERPARKKPSGFDVREGSAFFGGSGFRGERPRDAHRLFSFRGKKAEKREKT